MWGGTSRGRGRRLRAIALLAARGSTVEALRRNALPVSQGPTQAQAHLTARSATTEPTQAQLHQIARHVLRELTRAPERQGVWRVVLESTVTQGQAHALAAMRGDISRGQGKRPRAIALLAARGSTQV